jgi:hypothetical protein
MGLFSAAFASSPSKSDHRQRLPFSRSYGDILPSSLATFPSIALESSSRLPVSVCGTGTIVLARGFSWRLGIGPISTSALASTSELPRGFSYVASYVAASGTTVAPLGLSFLVPPSLITNYRWCWNVDQLSIAYAFRPRLRSRLTLGRLTLPRKP